MSTCEVSAKVRPVATEAGFARGSHRFWVAAWNLQSIVGSGSHLVAMVLVEGDGWGCGDVSVQKALEETDDKDVYVAVVVAAPVRDSCCFQS